jgi:Kef-type K+ transport system membrane component KefB
MFAIKTRRRWAVIVAVLGAWFAIAWVLALVVPREGATNLGSFVSWVVILPVALVAWAALELGGTWLLSRPALKRMSSAARIGIVISAVLVVVGVLAIATHLARGYAL